MREAIIVLVDLEEEVDGPEVLLHEEQDAHGVDVEDVRGVHLRLLPSMERPGLVEAYEEHSLGLYLLQHFHEVLVHHDAPGCDESGQQLGKNSLESDIYKLTHTCAGMHAYINAQSRMNTDV